MEKDRHGRKSLPYAIRVAIRLLPAALLTCTVALWNGFPLAYPDSGNYLNNARDLIAGREPWFFDRPLTYGIFLIPFITRYTIWLLPVAQGFIVAFAVELTLSTAGVAISARDFLVLFAGLSVFSSLPWFSGQIMPDVFTGVLVLLSYVLVWGGRRLGPVQRGLAGSLLTLSIASHLSHFPLYLALLTFGLIWRALSGKSPNRWRSLAPAIFCAGTPLALAAALVIAPNYIWFRELRFSRSSSLFTLARLVGEGLPQRYLARACLTRDYILCANLPELRSSVDWFLWSPDGPRRQHLPGLKQRDSRFLDEAPEIVWGTIRQEWRAVIRTSFVNSARQLVTFGIHPAEHRFSRATERATPAVAWYRASAQVQNALPIGAARLVVHATTISSALALVASFVLLRGRVESGLWVLVGTIVFGLVMHAFIIGSLALVHDRYQSRIVWLLPFAASVVIARLIATRQQDSESAT